MTTALLTFEQMRQRLNVGKSTLYALLEGGHIPGAIKVGGWRIDPKDLEAFIQSKKRTAEPAAVAVAAALDADEDLPPLRVRRFA